MNNSLSSYFSGIAAKRLSKVEINPVKSNQHEFNGIKDLKTIFGGDKIVFKGVFIYLNSIPENTINEEGRLTWYDARANHPTRTEYRLYYSSNAVIASANEGDLLIIGLTSEEQLVVIIAEEGSTSEQQLKWLFNLEEVENKFIVRDLKSEHSPLNFAGRHIISTLGIEVQETIPDYLELLIEKFGKKFPSTRDFSEFARSTVDHISVINEPDLALMQWMEQEELLFRTLEKYIVSEKLRKGFGEDGVDVDDFVKYSLSVQNRRKSRAGHSFEHHLAAVFETHGLLFSKGKKTERNNKPDFLFPGVHHYHSPDFNAELLTMLGVKTSAKDRWRQVLSEAEKISFKHLITLEPSISIHQTEEMKEQNLQLVIPSSLFETYTVAQRTELINLQGFIDLIKEKQNRM